MEIMSRFLKKFNTSRIATQWKRLNENRHFKYGAPFMLLVVGSPFVLKPLMSVSITISIPRLLYDNL